MIKKYRVYFKEGYQTSKKLLKNKGNFLRYYLIYLIDLLGTALFLLKPITSMSIYRMLKMGASGDDFSISKATASADNPKTYWSLIWAFVLKFMMVLVGVVVLAAVTFALYFLGLGINEAFPRSDEILPFLISLPGAIAVVAFLLVVIFSTMPLSYIINNNLSIGTSRALHKSVNAFKFGGKKAYIAILITKFALTLVYVAISYVLMAILVNNIDYMYQTLAATLGIIVLVCIYILFITRINLAFDIAKVNLLDDVLCDKVLGEKKYTGVKFESVDDSRKLNKLERLFETDAVMMSDNRFDLIRSLRDINGTNTELGIDDSGQQITEGSQTEEVVSGPVVESVLSVEEIETNSLENDSVEPDFTEDELTPSNEEVEELDKVEKNEKVSFIDKIKKGFKNIIPSKKEKALSKVKEESLEDEIIEEEVAIEDFEDIVEEVVNDDFINPEEIEKALAIEEPIIMTEEEKLSFENQIEEETLLEEQEVVEEVIYVDEDGNPIEILEDQEVIEEIIYVDEDGNPIEIEEGQEIIDEVIEEVVEEPTEIVEEKPKRGRKKKTVEDGE